jgi:hypothetical protein
MSARVALALALVAAGACGGASEPVPPRVVGLVVELDAEGETVRGFVLEADGERYEIRIDPEIDYGFDLLHLRDHLRSRQPVDVRLDQRGDAVYATEILDA